MNDNIQTVNTLATFDLKKKYFALLRNIKAAWIYKVSSNFGDKIIYIGNNVKIRKGFSFLLISFAIQKINKFIANNYLLFQHKE